MHNQHDMQRVPVAGAGFSVGFVRLGYRPLVAAIAYPDRCLPSSVIR
jgi:hypothetical protein